MPRQRTYVDTQSNVNDPHAVQFAKRLNKLMLAKGWRQSELARRAEAFLPEGESFGRHLVSSYLRGASMPKQMNLDALCKALGAKTTELVPEGAATVVGATDRAVHFTMGAHGTSRLKFDIELPNDIALQIMTLVNSARQKGGG